MTDTPAVATGETSTSTFYVIQAPDGSYFAPLATRIYADLPTGWSRDPYETTHYATRSMATEAIARIACHPGTPQGQARAVADPLSWEERYKVAAAQYRYGGLGASR